MSTEKKVDYALIMQKLGAKGFILAKILVNDMIASHNDGYVGAYTKDNIYIEVDNEMDKLISHLIKYEDAILEADHLVSLRNINKNTFN